VSPARERSGSLPALSTVPVASLPAGSQPPGVAAFQPLRDAAVGEWARYAAMASRTIRYDVDEVTATTVKTRITVRDHGTPLGLPAIREDPRDLDPVARQARSVEADRRRTSATIEAAGRQWRATLYEDRWTDEEIPYLRRTWVSPEVPVFGTIRMELYGNGTLEARLELVAAGTAP